jgi:hypothetical protein
VKKRIYIAGPMTGLPEYNYPAFNDLAECLRSLGWEVENPAENPVPPSGEWIDYMRQALPQLMTCEFIVMLPGWEKSRGACIEKRVAASLGIYCVMAENISVPPSNREPVGT